MPKFEANSLAAIRDPEARVAGRLSRASQYASKPELGLIGLAYVVAVEASDGSWVELDAESLEHGQTLARNWVDCMGARGASVWKVLPNGQMASKASYNYYEKWS